MLLVLMFIAGCRNSNSDRQTLSIQDSIMIDIGSEDLVILSPVKNKSGTKDSLLLLLERNRNYLSLLDVMEKKLYWRKKLPFPKALALYGTPTDLYLLNDDQNHIIRTDYDFRQWRAYQLDSSKANFDMSFPFRVERNTVILNAIPKESNLFTDSSREVYFSARQVVQYDLSITPYGFRALDITFPLRYLKNDYFDSYPKGAFGRGGLYAYVFRHCDSLFLCDDVHKISKVVPLPKSISVQTRPMDKNRITDLAYAKEYEALSNSNIYIRYHKGFFYLFQKKATERLDASGKLNDFESAPKQIVQLDTAGNIMKIYDVPQTEELRGAVFFNDMFITKAISNGKIVLHLSKI